ncbi:MAG TPA: TetR/AcrR family transcriptional regulator [Leptospiraceae bacterium]|nr:TetR/AcrR family transcriptional regulator [Leptospiraceae bacterium]HMZ57889.1 TetR/AcrR family transcriptional regulator [Leptospiraceae bacterium]
MSNHSPMKTERKKKAPFPEPPEIDFGDMTEKQKLVFLAAVDIISKKGFNGATTSMIAEKAGVAEGTIFKHFKSKKDLLVQITVPVITKLFLPVAFQAVNKVFKGNYSSFREFLTYFITERIMFAGKYSKYLKILVQEIPVNEDLREFIIKEFRKKVWPNLKELIESFQKKGELTKMPPEAVFSCMISVGGAYLYRRIILLPREVYDDKKDIEMLVNHILFGISAK